MAPRTRKRKASGETSETEMPAPVKTAKPAAKRPTRAKAKQADDEDAKDEGRARSRSFFQGTKNSNKPRRLNVNSAKGEIRDAVDEIVGFIDKEQRKTGPVVDLGDALRQHLPPKCASIMAPGYTGIPNSAGKSSHNTNFEKAFQILGQLKESTKLYEALACSRDNTIAKPDWMHWEQDQRDLKGLNQYAMTTAARTINDLIIPNPKSPVPVLPKGAGVVEKVAWELFDNVRPNRMEATWGRIAQEQVRAFTGILRSMKEE